MLQLLGDILITDIKNVFEDISVLENLNKYKKKYSENPSLRVKIWKEVDTLYFLKEVPLREINTFLMNIFWLDKKNFFLKANRLKTNGEKLFLNILEEKKDWEWTLKYKRVSFIFDVYDYQYSHFNKEFWKITWVKLIKNSWVYMLWFFFEWAHIRISFESAQLIFN